MRTRQGFLRAGLAALVLVAAMGAGAGAHTASWRTRVSINYDGVRFHGKVRSSHADCVPGRRVRVYHKIPGADYLVGSDLTNTSGEWEVFFVPPAGESFYAKTKHRITMHGADEHVCRGDTSPLITV